MSRIKLTEEQKATLVATVLIIAIVVITLILNRAV